MSNDVSFFQEKGGLHIKDSALVPILYPITRAGWESLHEEAAPFQQYSNAGKET